MTVAPRSISQSKVGTLPIVDRSHPLNRACHTLYIPRLRFHAMGANLIAPEPGAPGYVTAYDRSQLGLALAHKTDAGASANRKSANGFSVWMRLKVRTAGAFWYMASSQDLGVTDQGWVSDDGYGGGFSIPHGPGGLAVDGWYDLGCTTDPATGVSIAYVNGAEVGRASVAVDGGTMDWMDSTCFISDVRQWDRAITPVEMRILTDEVDVGLRRAPAWSIAREAAGVIFGPFPESPDPLGATYGLDADASRIDRPSLLTRNLSLGRDARLYGGLASVLADSTFGISTSFQPSATAQHVGSTAFHSVLGMTLDAAQGIVGANVTLGAAILLAADAVSAQVGQSVYAQIIASSQDASYAPPGVATGDVTTSTFINLTLDAISAQIGNVTLGEALAVGMDADYDLPGQTGVKPFVTIHGFTANATFSINVGPAASGYAGAIRRVATVATAVPIIYAAQLRRIVVSAGVSSTAEGDGA